MIIDTHCHIFDSKFDDNREEVIQEALNMGVKKLIVVGYDKETSLKAIEFANKYNFCYATIGLHPSEVKYETDAELSWIEKLINHKKVVAIGEIGLDYYWDKTYVEEQKLYFEKQISLAKKYDLPIIVHCRDAINDCYNILKKHEVKGVMHCFSSSYEMAKEFTKLGFYLGIGGVVTFKNSVEIKKVVSLIDIKYLLSETDCPYLAPEPFRGKTNHPGYTKYVVEKIAQIKEMPEDLVKKQLEENAKKLFKLGD